VSEFLTVRLSRQADNPVHWLVWSTSQQEVIASGTLSGHAELGELSVYAERRTTLLLLDSSDVMLSEVEIPPGAGRQLESMLPFLMEDDIAQDVEQLHFHLMKKSAETAQVALLDATYLRRLLEQFKQAGIEVKKVLPDVLALPAKSGTITALQLDQQWLLRKPDLSGLSVSTEMLPLVVASDWRGEGEEALSLVSYTPLPDGAGDEWLAAEPELVMELLSRGAIASPVNLLSGAFKPQSSLLKHLKVWRSAGIMALLLLAVLTAQNIFQIRQSEAHAQAYRAESERIFRVVLVGKKKIPTVSYLKRQMNDEERRLSAGSSEEGMLPSLMMLQQALSGQAVSFTGLRYDARRGEIRLDVEMKDFQAFEVVRTRLAESFAVTQGPLDREGEKVAGSFVLRSKQ
jgi:general secretion pathway protein L